MNVLKHTDDLGPELAAYIRRIFGPFDFEGIELRLPTHDVRRAASTSRSATGPSS